MAIRCLLRGIWSVNENQPILDLSPEIIPGILIPKEVLEDAQTSFRSSGTVVDGVPLLIKGVQELITSRIFPRYIK